MCGLGEILAHEACHATRFVDLFSGSGMVSYYVASRFAVPVHTVDLQRFSSILSSSYLCRTNPLEDKDFLDEWLGNAQRYIDRSPLRVAVTEWLSGLSARLRKMDVLAARRVCSQVESAGVVWNAYGGHYLSPLQAMQTDALLATLPVQYRNEFLASLIMAVSKAVASPGHTAQPFQPTRTSLPYIDVAWSVDVMRNTADSFGEISRRHAQVVGEAWCCGAQDFVDRNLEDGDLVFIDPPYSGVQYSRFYHVLETIANQKRVNVFGKGRYPPIAERPQSAFSNKGTSVDAFELLMKGLATKRITAIVTFPKSLCSNGLSGEVVKELTSAYFNVKELVVDSTFSTLGGNNDIRDARKYTNELILVLKK